MHANKDFDPQKAIDEAKEKEMMLDADGSGIVSSTEISDLEMKD